MSDPTTLVDRTASVYAKMMGEDWDRISPERRLMWRGMAFRVYEVHVKNRIDAIEQCITVVEDVQTARSTPKNWLKGAQEVKNALVLFHMEAIDDLTTRVEVPDTVPEDLNAEDPYATLKAGDVDPESCDEHQQCGAQHDDLWQCTRLKHPEHFQHWDSNLGDVYDYDEDEEHLRGLIIATWRDSATLESLHPAIGDLEEHED